MVILTGNVLDAETVTITRSRSAEELVATWELSSGTKVELRKSETGFFTCNIKAHSSNFAASVLFFCRAKL